MLSPSPFRGPSLIVSYQAFPSRGISLKVLKLLPFVRVPSLFLMPSWSFFSGSFRSSFGNTGFCAFRRQPSFFLYAPFQGPFPPPSASPLHLDRACGVTFISSKQPLLFPPGALFFPQHFPPPPSPILPTPPPPLTMGVTTRIYEGSFPPKSITLSSSPSCGISAPPSFYGYTLVVPVAQSASFLFWWWSLWSFPRTQFFSLFSPWNPPL